MGGDAVFLVKNVTKKYGSRKVLEGVTFTVNRGEILGFIGSSGAGKTTLLNMIVGFVPNTTGTIEFRVRTSRGIEHKNVHEYQQQLANFYGFTSQHPSFYEKLTVMENLTYFGRMYNLSGETIEKNASQLLEFLDLKSCSHLLAEHLSGGMQRRLDIACALIHNPAILIMDEPTADLDPVLRNHIWEIVKQINSRGTTVILSSHHLNDLDALCTRIGIVKEGKLLDIDSPSRLKDKYSKSQEIMVETFPGNYDDLVRRLKLKPEEYKRLGTYLTIRTENTEVLITKILGAIKRMRESLLDMRIIKPNLDDMFVNLYTEEKKEDIAPVDVENI